MPNVCRACPVSPALCHLPRVTFPVSPALPLWVHFAACSLCPQVWGACAAGGGSGLSPSQPGAPAGEGSAGAAWGKQQAVWNSTRRSLRAVSHCLSWEEPGGSGSPISPASPSPLLSHWWQSWELLGHSRIWKAQHRNSPEPKAHHSWWLLFNSVQFCV